jgi:hypothetical protein
MLEFKAKLEKTFREAKEAGLSDEEILLELMEQTKNFMCKVAIKVAGK